MAWGVERWGRSELSSSTQFSHCWRRPHHFSRNDRPKITVHPDATMCQVCACHNSCGSSCLLPLVGHQEWWLCQNGRCVAICDIEWTIQKWERKVLGLNFRLHPSSSSSSSVASSQAECPFMQRGGYAVSARLILTGRDCADSAQISPHPPATVPRTFSTW